MKKFIYLAALILFVIPLSGLTLRAQIGFNYFNQRNHPELKWQVLETEHFKIIFHQRIERTAYAAARIAEECYPPITANLNHRPKGKISIYLSDQDEIANGFDFSNRYIVIWVNVNQYILQATGEDKWLRKVIGHELVHYVHFSAISTWAGIIGQGFSQTPRWFTEGLAQYQSETWNVHRGDLVLRTRVLEDEMNYYSFQYPSDGAMLYASGNAAVRFLAEKYGDSTLVKILHHRDHFLLPYYDFNRAFKVALKRTPRDFLREWRKYMNIYYNSAYAQKEEISDFAQKIKLPFNYIYDLKISPDSLWYVVVALQSIDEPIRKLYLVNTSRPKNVRILDHNNVLPGISFSPDGEKIVYAKYRRGDYGSLIPDLLVTDLKGKKQRITAGLRASMPTWSPHGDQIVCVSNQNGAANLVRLKPDGSDCQNLTHFTGDLQLSYPTWSPDGKWLATMLSDTNGQRDLVAISVDGKNVYKITDDHFDNRQPVWSPNGQCLAFTSYRTGIPNLFLKNLGTSPASEWTALPASQVTDAASGLYPVDWQGDSLIALVVESKFSQSAYRLSARRVVAETPVQIKSKYVCWQTRQPPHGLPPFQLKNPDSRPVQRTYAYHSWQQIQHYFTIPLPLIDVDRYGLSLYTYWAEPLGKHNFLGLGDFMLNAPNESRFIGAYMNNQWHPTIILSAFYYPWEGQFFADQFLIEEHKGASIDVWWPFNCGEDLFANHLLQFQLRYFRNEPMNPEQFSDPSLQPETKQVGEFTLGYQWRQQHPHRWLIIHPRRSEGVRFQIRLADKKWGSQLTYQLYESDAYAHFPLPWRRQVVYARLKMQLLHGNVLNQHQIGFDKYDQLDFGLGLPLGERERLRGISEYQFGNRLVFGNLEYRFPLKSNLGWYLAGLAFNQVTGAIFLDYGAVWWQQQQPLKKIRFLKTAGIEFKNTVSIGAFQFAHALGLAWDLSQPHQPSEIYYRIRSVVPF